MATADKAHVIGSAKAGFDLQASLPWASSTATTKITRDLAEAFAAVVGEDVSVWTGQMTVAAAGGYKQWYLNTAVVADREINSLNIQCNCDKVHMLWIRNLGDHELLLESDAGGIGEAWTQFLSDGSYLHLPAGTTLIAFSATGWVVGANMALNFKNNHGSETVDVECGIVGVLA